MLNKKDLMYPNLTEMSDSALMIAIARYEQDALEEVYHRYGGAVYHTTLYTINNKSLAEELTQEVFLAIWKSPEKYDCEKASLRAFLLRVAHNKAVDAIRSEESRKRREQKDAENFTPIVEDVAREIVDDFYSQEITSALSSLSPLEKESLELAYLQSYTYREVAVILETPEGTIKSRIRSGLKHLKEKVGDTR